MKVSLSWLGAYVRTDMPVSEMTERLTMAGLELDSATDRYAWMDSVRVGRIETVSPHPNADRLSLCDVYIGDRSVRVVCGAPNAEAGMLAPLALPGTEFPGGVILGKSVIRGEASEGMLCSEIELELGDDASGLMALDESLTPGTPLAEALGLSDVMIEIDLTPNRPDCLSVLGVAREIASFERRRVTYPEIRLPEGEKQIGDLTSVTIESPDHCPRYAARLIEGVTIKPSPHWLRDRLLSVGLRPISNIVDVTNFVMMEMGQPLHAFDFDHLTDNRIVVRTAEQGEKFTTLDGKERILASDMLMICDGEKPVAVGGVMGGLNSEIEDTTTRVLIEGAYFDPVSIRRTAKRLGLGTDASHRFERGVDPEATVRAIDRAAQLMLEVAGGTLVSGVIDERPVRVKNRPVTLDVSAANRRLGLSLSADQITDLLTAIEFEVTQTEAGTLTVLPPDFRVDVSRPEDLSEEIARCWGYNRIPVTFPGIPAQAVAPAPAFEMRKQIRDLMACFGFADVVNYSFIDARSCDRLRIPENDPRRRLLHIRNPLTEEMSVMRSTLIPGLLETMGRNIARQNRNLKLFEIGKIFIADGPENLPEEIETAAALWTGSRSDLAWHEKEQPCDFYDLKGVAEGLLTGMGIEGAVFTALPDSACDGFQPGYAAEILLGEKRIGKIGRMHPEVLDAYDLKQDAYVFEMDADALSEFASDVKTARPLPKYPSISRDITLIISRDKEAGALLRSIREMNEPLVEDVFLFDVYEGKNIEKGKKNVSIRIVYRSDEGTLEDENVTGLHQQISEMLLKRFDATFPA